MRGPPVSLIDHLGYITHSLDVQALIKVQITRNSLYNLKSISSNLKQKYNSRMELRQQSQMYNELWDDDADDVDEIDFYHRSYDY